MTGRPSTRLTRSLRLRSRISAVRARRSGSMASSRVGVGHGITGGLNRPADGHGGPSAAGSTVHGGVFGGEIHLRLLHAGKPLQGILDASGAAGAVHAADGQIKALGRHAANLPRRPTPLPPLSGG